MERNTHYRKNIINVGNYSAAFFFGAPISNCSLVVAHCFLQSPNISPRDFLASSLSFDDPTGGGRVSAKTHFDIHDSKYLSVLVPLSSLHTFNGSTTKPANIISRDKYLLIAKFLDCEGTNVTIGASKSSTKFFIEFSELRSEEIDMSSNELL